MSIENEEEILEEEEKELLSEPTSKVSRARNRTVMLTPEMTGQVRTAIREERKAPTDSDFTRPNAISKEQYAKVQEPVAPVAAGSSDSSQQSNLGLKFGKSVNRSRTTKFSREDLDKATMPTTPAPVIHESADGFNLPNPVVPKAFDPLTSVAPPNHSPGKMGESSFSAPRSAPKPAESRPMQTQAPLLQSHLPLTQPATVARGQALTGSTKIIGFMVSFDKDPNGEVYEIRAGRKLITSRPTEHGEYMLIEHASISPLHAILRSTKDGRLQVLDQLSEHGTGITRLGETEEVEVAGGLELVENGDTLRFGERRFLISLLPLIK